MKTTYINNTYRAAVSDNCLFIFNEKEDTLVMKINNVSPHKNEVVARHFDSLEEFYSHAIIPMIVDELQSNVQSDLLLNLLLHS